MRGGCSGGVVTKVTTLQGFCKVSAAASRSVGVERVPWMKESGQKLQEKQSLHAAPPNLVPGICWHFIS